MQRTAFSDRQGCESFQIAVVSEVAPLHSITVNLIHEMANSQTLSKERIQQIWMPLMP